MGRVDGKVILISGGARGIGAADARALVNEGASVVVADILDEEGSALADELGTNARFVHLDVTRPEQWANALSVALEAFGTITGLVNNAGVFSIGPLHETELSEWHRVLDVNLTGTFLGMKTVIPSMISAGGGSIINISSLEGMMGSAGMNAYVASKFGVRGLTKSSALELAAFGIRVNSIHPGLIWTPMTEGIPEDMVTVPIGRGGKPEEVASFVVFLSSEESSYATGSEFVMDGGIGAGIVHKVE
jgi:3alpha(or 20beta)-hydroxysteroid dehydrogenase